MKYENTKYEIISKFEFALLRFCPIFYFKNYDQNKKYFIENVFFFIYLCKTNGISRLASLVIVLYF